MAHSFREFVNKKISTEPHFFVIGHPITHSLSPLMHNTALLHYKLDATYYAVDILPEDLPAFTAWCNNDAFLGCNVTLPYKQQLYDMVDSRSEMAEKIGAINTISKKGVELIGHNTDIFGFLEPLKQFTDVIEDNDAIVFGTGGASGAVVQGLRAIGVNKIYLVTRNPAIKQSENHTIEYIGYSQWTAYADAAAIVVNTTPLGMHPHIDQSPVRDKEARYLEGKICYDLVYNPRDTLFLTQAQPFADTVINGIDMLIQQGSRSFEIWTGKPFPVNAIKEKMINFFKSV